MTAEAVPLAQSRRQAPRRVWLALLLTLLLTPMTGYLYVGRPRRALAFAIYWVLLFFAFRNGLGGGLATPVGWLTLAAFTFVPPLIALADVLRIAWRERGYALRGFNRWWLYLIAGIAMMLGGQALVDPDLGGFLAVRPFSTPSGSMAPTLNIGDRAVGDMRAYERAAPQPGDVVIFHREDDDSFYVKRVIAGPGDRVALSHGVVFVNGAPARQDPIGGGDPPARAIETLANQTSHVILPGVGLLPQADDMAEVVVPADSYFLLGDNRANSEDSRFSSFGFAPRARILGRLTFVYWSSDRRHIGATIP